jgi:hypothetical protein
MGGKGVMIKAPGDLQDQKQKICAAAKAELRWWLTGVTRNRQRFGWEWWSTQELLIRGKPSWSDRSHKLRPEANR